MGTRFERCLVARKSEDSPDFRIGGREGGGRRAAPVEDQPARIVAECVDAQMPPHLPVQYRVKSGCTLLSVPGLGPCLGLSASGERCVNLSQFSQYSTRNIDKTLRTP